MLRMTIGAGLTVGDWISIAGLFVAVVGFSFTVQQLHRTATASEAANTLLASVGERMQMNHLLVMLPQLHVLADELDAGVIADDARGVARTLVAYSRTAVQVASLLSVEDAQSAELGTQLRESSAQARQIKGLIVSGTKIPLAKLLKTVMAEISESASAASGLVSKYQMKVS